MNWMYSGNILIFAVTCFSCVPFSHCKPVEDVAAIFTAPGSNDEYAMPDFNHFDDFTDSLEHEPPNDYLTMSNNITTILNSLKKVQSELNHTETSVLQELKDIIRDHEYLSNVGEMLANDTNLAYNNTEAENPSDHLLFLNSLNRFDRCVDKTLSQNDSIGALISKSSDQNATTEFIISECGKILGNWTMVTPEEKALIERVRELGGISEQAFQVLFPKNIKILESKGGEKTAEWDLNALKSKNMNDIISKFILSRHNDAQKNCTRKICNSSSLATVTSAETGVSQNDLRKSYVDHLLDIAEYLLHHHIMVRNATLPDAVEIFDSGKYSPKDNTTELAQVEDSLRNNYQDAKKKPKSDDFNEKDDLLENQKEDSEVTDPQLKRDDELSQFGDAYRDVEVVDISNHSEATVPNNQVDDFKLGVSYKAANIDLPGLDAHSKEVQNAPLNDTLLVANDNDNVEVEALLDSPVFDEDNKFLLQDNNHESTELTINAPLNSEKTDESTLRVQFEEQPAQSHEHLSLISDLIDTDNDPLGSSAEKLVEKNMEQITERTARSNNEMRQDNFDTIDSTETDIRLNKSKIDNSQNDEIEDKENISEIADDISEANGDNNSNENSDIQENTMPIVSKNSTDAENQNEDHSAGLDPGQNESSHNVPDNANQNTQDMNGEEFNSDTSADENNFSEVVLQNETLNTSSKNDDNENISCDSTKQEDLIDVKTLATKRFPSDTAKNNWETCADVPGKPYSVNGDENPPSNGTESATPPTENDTPEYSLDGARQVVDIESTEIDHDGNSECESCTDMQQDNEETLPENDERRANAPTNENKEIDQDKAADKNISTNDNDDAKVSESSLEDINVGSVAEERMPCCNDDSKQAISELRFATVKNEDQISAEDPLSQEEEMKHSEQDENSSTEVDDTPVVTLDSFEHMAIDTNCSTVDCTTDDNEAESEQDSGSHITSENLQVSDDDSSDVTVDAIALPSTDSKVTVPFPTGTGSSELNTLKVYEVLPESSLIEHSVEPSDDLATHDSNYSFENLLRLHDGSKNVFNLTELLNEGKSIHNVVSVEEPITQLSTSVESDDDPGKKKYKLTVNLPKNEFAYKIENTHFNIAHDHTIHISFDVDGAKREQKEIISPAC